MKANPILFLMITVSVGAFGETSRSESPNNYLGVRGHAGSAPGRAGSGGALTPLACNEGVKRWASELSEIARRSTLVSPRGGYYTSNGGLVDANKFMSDSTRGTLEGIVQKSSPDGKTSLFVSPREATFIANGEAWSVSESPWYRDQFPNGLAADRVRLVIRSEPGLGIGNDDHVKVNEFFLRDVVRNGKIDFEKFRGFAEEANRNSAREVTDPARIADYDLPKDEAIGYVGLLPSTNDVIIDGTREDVNNFPRYLGCLGYNFVGLPSGSVANVNGPPKEIIQRMVKDYVSRGIKTIYLSPNSHGSEKGIGFKLLNGRHVMLTPEDLKSVFDENPGVKFVVDTVACHAGGIAEMMENYKDPTGQRGRVTAFLQTKGTGLNQEGRLVGRGNPPAIKSTYYNIFRVAALASGKTFGQAHLEADKFAKGLTPSDAEAYVSTGHGGVGTKAIGN